MGEYPSPEYARTMQTMTTPVKRPGPGRPRKPITHGVPAGYTAHRRRGEEPCDACREARRTYSREHARTYTRPLEVVERKRAYNRDYNRKMYADQEKRKKIQEANREWARKRREDPEYRERLNAKERDRDKVRRREDPEYRDARNEHSREYIRKTWADPEGRKRLQEFKRRYETSEHGKRRARERQRKARTQIGSSVRTRELMKQVRKTQGGKVPGIPTLGTLQGRLDYYGGRCWMCGADTVETGLHWDHVKPLAKGGADALCNLRPACPSCNIAKSDTWPYERSTTHDQ